MLIAFAGLEAYAHLNRQGAAAVDFHRGVVAHHAGAAARRDALREYAIALGVLPDAVFSTSKVRNTADEANAVAAMLPAGSTVLLVTLLSTCRGRSGCFNTRALGAAVPDFQASGAWAGNPCAIRLILCPRQRGCSSNRAIKEAIGRTLYGAW